MIDPNRRSHEDRYDDNALSPALFPEHARFVGWTLVMVVAFMSCIMAVNWYVDPTGVTGRETPYTVADNTEVREVKLNMIDDIDDAPDVLVLGSSRSMKLDPKVIKREAGVSAFNAAVSGGVNRDFNLYARYAHKRWDELPHLVIGITNDTFRDDDTNTLVTDQRLLGLLDERQRLQERVASIPELASMGTFKLSLKAVMHGPVAQAQASQVQDDSDRAVRNQRSSYRKDGMQLFDPIFTGTLDERVDKQMRNFIKGAFAPMDTFTGVSAGGNTALSDLIRFANEQGDEPVLWLTPFQPDAAQLLADTTWQQRDMNMRRQLDRMRASGLRFQVIDLTDPASFSGTREDWHDGIHMTEANTARVVAELEREGAFDM